MLKAKRNPKKAEKKMVEDFTKDMQEAKEVAQVKAQKEEFGAWLDEKMTAKKYNEFFHSMHTRVSKGQPLTENMVNALRKCMEKEKEWAKERETRKDAPPREITLKIKPFLMKDLKIDSRIISGVVKAESAKAWLIEGKADMLENMSFCARCGKELTEPASQVTGFGAICAEKLGIPYDSAGVLDMTARQRTAIRKKYKKKLHDQTFERWIPKSRAEVFEN